MSIKLTSSWDGSIGQKGLGNFSFENQVLNQPLDFVIKQRWAGWTEVDHCKICGKGPFSITYEIVLEWGDTKKYERISEVCTHCLELLNENVVRNKQNPLKY